MGLELAEFTMDLEDNFKIEFPEDQTIEPTVGGITDWIHQELSKKEKRICYSSHCFYKFRSIIAKTFNLNRRQIRPSTKIRSLIDRQTEEANYEYVLRRINKLAKGFPGKTFIPNVIGLFYCVTVFSILASLVFYPSTLAFLYSILCVFIMISVSNINKHKLQKMIYPKNCAFTDYFETFGDAAQQMASNLQPADIQNTYPIYSRQQINNIIKDILIDEFQCKPEELTDDAHLVKDLNMG